MLLIEPIHKRRMLRVGIQTLDRLLIARIPISSSRARATDRRAQLELGLVQALLQASRHSREAHRVEAKPPTVNAIHARQQPVVVITAAAAAFIPTPTDQIEANAPIRRDEAALIDARRRLAAQVERERVVARRFALASVCVGEARCWLDERPIAAVVFVVVGRNEESRCRVLGDKVSGGLLELV